MKVSRSIGHALLVKYAQANQRDKPNSTRKPICTAIQYRFRFINSLMETRALRTASDTIRRGSTMPKVSARKTGAFQLLNHDSAMSKYLMDSARSIRPTRIRK